MTLTQGTAGDDEIFGTSLDEMIFAQGGDDTVDGGGGNDTVGGAAGNDFLMGGDGNDEVFGAGGNDEVLGDAGDDTIFGGAGNDLVIGGAGDDEIFGGSGSDILFGDEVDGTDLASVGSDTFVFAPGFGNDVILDFNISDFAGLPSDTLDFQDIDVVDVSFFRANFFDRLSGQTTEFIDAVLLSDRLGNTVTIDLINPNIFFRFGTSDQVATINTLLNSIQGASVGFVEDIFG